MQTLLEFINHQKFEYIVSEELLNIYRDDIMISESFQSSLLSKLAKKIKDVEKNRPKSDAELNNTGYFSSSDKEELQRHSSFSEIFKPTTKNNQIKGVKWNNITDNDFKLFKVGDKKFKSECNKLFGDKINGIIITCKPDTQEIVCFANALSTGVYKNDYHREFGNLIYSFTKKISVWTKNEEGKNVNVTGFKTYPLTKSKYSYGSRPLKGTEAYEILKDYDNYVLYITDDMFMEYGMLNISRKDAQKNIVSNDPKYLEKLLKDQRARYKAMADEIRKNKLQNSDKQLYQEIKTIQEEVIKLNEDIMDNYDNMDLYGYMVGLLNDCNRAFEYYYNYFKGIKKSEARKQIAAANGRRYDPNWDFDKADARSNLEYSKQYLDRIKKEIDEIKDMMKKSK